MHPKYIHVIANPAAGQDRPVLGILNRVFQNAGVDWDISITKPDADAAILATQAVANGADCVAVYGGDGTVMNVGRGLLGCEVPLAILPGGTANVLSIELGIPWDLAAAATLIVEEPRTRFIDVGQAGALHFVLRIGLGLEAAMVGGADRTLKERVGVLAYGLAAMQALREPTVSQYRLRLDGTEVEVEGVMCILANAGNVGRPGLSFAPDILVDDGKLDVIVLKSADLASLAAATATVLRGGVTDSVQHWQAREISVTADPAQPIQLDGEMLDEQSIHAHVLPSALRIVVPAAPAPSPA